jgi:hypothetical protein
MWIKVKIQKSEELLFESVQVSGGHGVPRLRVTVLRTLTLCSG